MTVNLQGKAALVTGGSKGIGRAVAESLVSAGAAVAIAARTRAEVEATATELGKGAAAPVVGLVADVGDPVACTRLVEEATSALGRLDILINNAGFGLFKSVEEMTWDEWRSQIDVNLGGVWACTKAALPHLREAAGGDDGAWVINIGSLAGRNTFAGGSGYNASKFGLVGMTEATMLDVRQHGIRVSLIMPGSVNTGFGNHETAPQRDWKLQPEDIAEAVMQLLAYPKGAHVSRMEMRPAMPARR